MKCNSLINNEAREARVKLTNTQLKKIKICSKKYKKGTY